MISLEKWLQAAGCNGLDGLCIKETFSEDGNSCDFGCIAKTSFEVGDVLFTVPQMCIFSFADVMCSLLAKEFKDYAIGVQRSDLVTAELLIWIEMCHQRQNPSCQFHVYMQSLSADEPTIASWDDVLCSCFEGTNLAVMIGATMAARWQEQFNLFLSFIDVLESNEDNKYFKLLSASPIDMLRGIDAAALKWARGHYLSRRYPGQFAVSSTPRLFEDAAITKERDFGNIGSLVPLLDLLNHRPEQQWITFNPTETELQVICNYPIAKVGHLLKCYRYIIIIYQN